MFKFFNTKNEEMNRYQSYLRLVMAYLEVEGYDEIVEVKDLDTSAIKGRKVTYKKSKNDKAFVELFRSDYHDCFSLRVDTYVEFRHDSILKMPDTYFSWDKKSYWNFTELSGQLNTFKESTQKIERIITAVYGKEEL